MQIIPVIDIRNGIVVQGVAGDRSKYQRIRSTLTDSCHPSVILRAFEGQFSLKTCYVADLDAIERQQLNHCTLAEMTQSDTPLIVDRGVRRMSDVEELLDLDVDQIVVALETLPEPQLASALIAEFGAERLVFSLDLKHRQLVTSVSRWQTLGPEEVISELADIGFSNFIILDVAAVGAGNGIVTLPLCQTVRAQFPDVSLITGGGIRSLNDLRQLQKVGVDGALVASALHDGSMCAESLAEFD